MSPSKFLQSCGPGFTFDSQLFSAACNIIHSTHYYFAPLHNRPNSVLGAFWPKGEEHKLTLITSASPVPIAHHTPTSHANAPAQVEWRKNPAAYKERVRALVAKANKNVPPHIKIPHPDTDPVEKQREKEKREEALLREAPMDLYDDDYHASDNDDDDDGEYDDQDDDGDEDDDGVDNEEDDD